MASVELSWPEPTRQAMDVADGRSGEVGQSKSCGAQMIMTTKHWALTLFDHTVIVTWFFPLGLRQYLIYFGLYRIPQLRILGF